MANQEHDNFNKHESFNDKALEHTGEAQRELIEQRLEHNADKGPEKNVESARREALDQASALEKDKPEKRQAPSPERSRVITKREKAISFDTTMREARSQLSPVDRTFSKIIHQPAIEKISEVAGKTVARPNAILSGSLFAFLFTASFYLIARFNGYPLSGTETIASFIIGWCVGMIIDYVRFLLFGKR